jgi:hypothetical protein
VLTARRYFDGIRHRTIAALADVIPAPAEHGSRRTTCAGMSTSERQFDGV